MKINPILRRMLASLPLVRLCGMAAVLFLVSANLARATNYLYYSDGQYRYDTDTGNWDEFVDDDWSSLGSAPGSPGPLTGGDNWETVTSFSPYTYQHDTYTDVWYLEEDEYIGWAPYVSPYADTQYQYYWDSGGDFNYRYNLIGGNWDFAPYGTEYFHQFSGPVGTAYLIGADAWEYLDEDHVYDPYLDVYYVKDQYLESPQAWAWVPE